MKKLHLKEGALINFGLASAVVSTFCCVGPLVLAFLGLTGAAVLSKFHFLQIPAILFVVLSFGYAGILLYGKKQVCIPGAFCEVQTNRKRMLIFFWIGLLGALMIISSPFWIPWWFGG